MKGPNTSRSQIGVFVAASQFEQSGNDTPVESLDDPTVRTPSAEQDR